MVLCLELCYKERYLLMTILSFFESMLTHDFMSHSRYMQDYWKYVMDFELKYLVQCCNVEEEETTMDGQSLYIPIQTVMWSINKQYIGESFPVLIQFVYQTIVSKSINDRVAALIVFDSLLVTSNNKSLNEDLQRGYDSFLSLFNDPDMFVQRYNYHLFLSMTKYQLDFLAEHNRILQLIDVLVNKISEPDNEDEYLKNSKMLACKTLNQVLRYSKMLSSKEQK